jgi:MFS family permease
MSSSAIIRRPRSGGTAAGRPQRAATLATFVSHGLLFASWTAHIPQLKDRLGLADGTLGLALLGAPLGSVLAMLVVAHLLPRLGSRRMVQVSLAGYALAGPLVGLSGSFAALFGTLFAWGAFQGALDVSMNTRAGRGRGPLAHAAVAPAGRARPAHRRPADDANAARLQSATW